jgi:hypothetical protein
MRNSDLWIQTYAIRWSACSNAEKTRIRVRMIGSSCVVHPVIMIHDISIESSIHSFAWSSGTKQDGCYNTMDVSYLKLPPPPNKDCNTQKATKSSCLTETPPKPKTKCAKLGNGVGPNAISLKSRSF